MLLGSDGDGVRLIVINPKRIDLCSRAEVWLRPLPGTDVALLNAMACVILDEGLAAPDFIALRTEEYGGWCAAVKSRSFDELARMRTAQRARTFKRPPGWLDWKGAVQLVGTLLIRALVRAERIHGAMCSRGWTGKMRSLD